MRKIKERFIANKVDILAVSLLIVLVAVLFAPMLEQVVQGKSDYNAHIRLAQEMVQTWRIESPHFLYQLLVIIAHGLIPGSTFSESGFLVALLSYVLLSLVIYLSIRPAFSNSTAYRASLASVLVTLAVMIVSPITILTWTNRNLYFGYIATSAYHNPTIVLLKPFALLLFFYAMKAFTCERTYNSRTTILIVGMLTLLSTMAKPSYIICLLPVLVPFSLYRYCKTRQVDWRLLVLGIGIPATVMLGWQLYVNFVPNEISPSQYRVVFAPFKVFGHRSSWLFPKFLLSMLLPLSVYVFYFKKAIRDIPINLCWLVFLMGSFYTYLLAEAGASSRMFAGNFAWSGQITSFILFVVSTAFFIGQERSSVCQTVYWKPSKRFYLCTAVFALHLVSGVLFYYVYLTGQAGSWW